MFLTVSSLHVSLSSIERKVHCVSKEYQSEKSKNTIEHDRSHGKDKKRSGETTMINLLCCLQGTKPLNCRGLLQPWDIALISQKVYSDNKMNQQKSIQVQLRYCQSLKKNVL